MNIELVEQIIRKITGRSESFFKTDLRNNEKLLHERVRDKSILVIGGAGTIGSYFIKALLSYHIARLYVIDINENGLAELIRDIRSSGYDNLPEIKTYPLNFSSKIFEKIFLDKGPFEIVANFAALKHVRSEKDQYAIEAMFENNFIQVNKLLVLLANNKPERFFCVSTDKATLPVNIMGATKKLMEDIIFSYEHLFNITTARFANVAFSNGSLLNSYINRYHKNQPIVCPSDIKRFFVSPQEAGELCLLACLLGETGDIFIPNLSPENDLIPFKKTIEAFFNEINVEIDYCSNEEEAKTKAKNLTRSPLDKYPVFLFKSDTSGEKAYEEFYSKNDIIDWKTLESIGVIKRERDLKFDTAKLLSEANKLFNGNINKDIIIDFLAKYIPDFSFIEKGKILDEKM